MVIMDVWSKKWWFLWETNKQTNIILDQIHQDTVHTEHRQKTDIPVPQILTHQYQHTPFWIQKSTNRGRRLIPASRELFSTEMDHHMSVSSTFGYNEHIRMAQNALQAYKDLLSGFPLIFLLRSLTNQCQHLPHRCPHMYTQCLHGQSHRGTVCEQTCPLFCNSCFSIVSLLLGLQGYLHNVWEYSIRPVIS